MAQRMKVAAETGDINGLYVTIKEDPNVLDSIDAIPFVDTPLHTAASAGHTDFAVEIFRLKPSFGTKLNPDGLSALHLALINHKFDTVKRLVKVDGELILVKGKQGETPLHFIARKEDINADQQQSVNADQQQKELDHNRVNTLAEFLFACPNSIEDLTNQDETALHIAVRTKNISAVAMILGLIRRIRKRRLVAIKDDKGNTALHLAVKNSQLGMVKLLVCEPFSNINAANSDKQTALDIALQLLADQSDVTRSAVEKTLRDAGALENSSSDENDYTLAKFLISPDRCFEVFYKLKFLMGGSESMEMRNMGLVVAVLIATATFTSVVSPPGGVGGGGNNLLTNGGNVNATVWSTNNLFAANTSFINVTLSIPTDNPVKRLMFNDVNSSKAHDLTYGYVFSQFYGLNTCAFFLSTAMIMFVLPVAEPKFFLLHGALLCTMMSYGFSFCLVSPSYGYCQKYATASILCAVLVYNCKILTSLIGSIAQTGIRGPFVSKLQSEHLMMLNHLLARIE